MGNPPPKRRKRDAPPRQPVKTLHDFFGNRPAAPKGTAPGKAAPTDDQYARKLTGEWRKEDKAVGGAAVEKEGSPSIGVKRRRDGSPSSPSSSPAISRGKPPPVDRQEPGPASAGPQRAIATATTTPEPRTPAPAATAAPNKPAVSAQDVLEIEQATGSMPFDSDPLGFDPDAYRSIVEKWPDGRATYGLLTRMFVLVNSTRSRIKIVDALVNFLRVLIRLDPESLLPAVWLTTNDIGPSYEANELGIGGSIVSKAILKTSGVTPASLKKLHIKHGDPGDVAFEAKAKQRTLMMRKPTPLTIRGVYTTLVKISGTSGKGSQDTKQRHVERLLVDAKGEEARYLTRTLIQHLRIGAVKTTMLIALSRAFSLSAPDGATWKPPHLPGSKEGRQELFRQSEETVKQCFSRRPNYNDIVPCLLNGGVQSLESSCGMEVHIPLKPMLGSITRDLAEMLVKLQGRDFSCEYKYDGQRAQIHCDEFGKVSIFSRHLESMTAKYPDIADLVPRIRGEGVGSFIMEGEVVAVDGETGSVKNFQTLAGRERKNVDVGRISVEVCLFAFDLMYLNGQELLSRSFRERRELLRNMFVQVPHRFRLVESLDATSADVDAVRDFFRSSLDNRCEGIMVKALDNSTEPLALTPEEAEVEEATSSKKGKEKEEPRKGGGRRKALLATYEPDKRLESWLKVKKDYDSAADTLDLVPIAAWHGSGRKSSWWSPILLAVRNPDTGTFEAVCKCMSGFTDKCYASMKETYSPDGPNTCPNKKPYYEARLDPAVWFEPKEVWEVAFADITLSPTYAAALGLVSDQRGLSLRFPRFVRRREDKSVEDASTPQFLADLYFRQERGAKKKEAGEGEGTGGVAGGGEEKIEEEEGEEEEEEEAEDEELVGIGDKMDGESDG